MIYCYPILRVFLCVRIELLPSRERGACALERGAYALNVERLVGPYGLLNSVAWLWGNSMVAGAVGVV